MDERSKTLISNMVEVIREVRNEMYNREFEDYLTKETGITHEELIECGVLDELRRIPNKEDFIRSLTDSQLQDGTIKFNIPEQNEIYSLNGEGVYGYISPTEYEKYDCPWYYGKITAILLNSPITYGDKLGLFDEVELQCHGNSRPTLDPDFVNDNLLCKE